MESVNSFSAPASGRSSARRSRLAGHGSPVTARRSRLAAFAANSAAEDFPDFQVYFPAVTPEQVTATPAKPAVAPGKAAVPPTKPVVTTGKVAVSPAKGGITAARATVTPAGVAVTFHPETAAFAHSAAKTPCFCQNSRFLAGFYRQSEQNKTFSGRADLPVCRVAARQHRPTIPHRNFGQSPNNEINNQQHRKY